MKKILSVVTIFLFTLSASAQKDASSKEDVIYKKVEKMPEFPGGEAGMMKFIQENINYPESAKKDSTQGVVYVSYIVGKTGAVRDVEIIKGFHKDCDQEAKRVVSLMSAWSPGMEAGKPVNVQYNLPIKFNLGGSH